MAQIEVKNLTFYYNDYYHPVFEKLNLNLDTDWKMALIGRNGRGKTTLLKLLQGSLEASSGSITRIGSVSYFPYSYDTKYKKAIDVVKECIGGIRTMELLMEEYAGDNERYFEVLEQYISLDGFEIESRIYKELAQMKLSSELLERDFASLSGGEQTCMLIIALFLRKDPFVLLDEPTNHLDREKKEFLKGYLKKKKGYIIVSHDTLFLDEVTDHILAINKTDVSLEQGTYSTWWRNMELKEQFELRTRQRLIQEISQLERQSQLNRTWSDAGNTQKYAFAGNGRTNGTRAYMTQAKAAEQHIKENLEKKKLLLRNMEEEKQLSIYQDILEEECLLSAENISYCYEGKKTWLFKDISLRVYRGDKIWIRGLNGVGKTTLLKVLSGRLESTNIIYADGLSIAYASQEPHWKSGDLKECFRRELRNPDDFFELYAKFKQICFLFDLPEEFDQRPLETLSSGELKKIDIARVLSSNHQVLFLDEPLNFMDVYFKAQLQAAVSDKELTVIFVEHNEEFSKAVANKVLEL